jgi:hypothetical protein
VAKKVRDPRADRCIFCGSTEISEEHIFGRKWIAKLFQVPRKEKLGHRHVRITGPIVDFDSWWQYKEADLAVYCVCRKCNSEWMNALDEQAQKIIAPMVRGRTTRITTYRDQLILARWITKLAFMFDYKQEKSSLPREFAERFHKTRLPPDNAYIWVAASPPVPGRYHASGHTWTTEGRTDGDWYLLTARVNDLIVQYLMPITPGGKIAPVRGRYGRAVRQVWPPTYKPLSWPPDEILSDVEYVGFAMTFILAAAHHDRLVDQFRDEVRAAASTEKG